MTLVTVWVFGLCLQCFDTVDWASGFEILSDEVLAWLVVWSEMQMICIWSSWCYCVCLCVCLCVCTSVYMSLSVCLYVCVCMYICLCLCVYVCVCLLSVCLCVYVYVYVSVCMSVYMSLSVYVCVCVCVCSASRLDDLLTPAPLSDKSLENHTIFRVPIIVIPGELISLVSSLQVSWWTVTLTHTKHTVTLPQHSRQGICGS